MRRLLIFLFNLVILLTVTARVFATSNYVLPYPSSMPGSFLYKPRLVLEKILKYWYFGDFGGFNYNLKESDKYLVQSKTLFEYGQYLLGQKALAKSDYYFFKTLPYLLKAKEENKNILQNRELLSQAAKKHIEVLQNLEKQIPEKFTWTPEKSKPSVLNLKDLIEKSIAVRNKYL